MPPTESNFTIHLQDIFEDLDGDEIEDHLDDDIDGDGFTNQEEEAYPSDPRDPNSVANTSPDRLGYFAPLAVFENQPNGRTVGRFTTSDTSGQSTQYSLKSGAGDSGNAYFHLLSDGTLTTAESFDYEGEQTVYSIRVGALLGSGQEVIHNFEVHILDDWGDNSYQGTGHGTYAGFDQSESTDYSNQSVTGTTGGYSSSEDNEIEQQGGFTFEQDQDNATELPLRVYAKLTVVENVPQGTVVAQFKGEDVDEDEVLSYSLVTGLGDDDNHLFTIDENGTLRAAWSDRL